jgi:hypothetical protein
VTPIPFEPQQTIDGNRTCGAAALTMVYRSMGLPCSQLTVWQRLAEEVRSGVKAARTHRLALDACGQGFSAVTLQAKQPAELLTQLLASDARVILNHRLDRQSRLGHYSVLLGFDGHEITIHDPHHGPCRVLPWPEFADLWNPRKGPSEIIGWVLVAIGPRVGEERVCNACRRALPTHCTCDRCGQRVSIGPAGAVGCCEPTRHDRLWARLFCPHCDWARNSPDGPLALYH